MARRIAAWMRHGQYQQPDDVPSAHLPYPLTQFGIEQARSAAKSLWEVAEKQAWRVHSVIDSSRMLRAWQTASVVAEALAPLAGYPFSVEEFDALAERGLGAAANLEVRAIEAIVRDDPRYGSLAPGWKADSHVRLPFQGAESMLEAGERVARHVDHRCTGIDDAGVDVVKVFVGHGGAFRHAAVKLGTLDLAEVRSLSMHHCRPVYMEREPHGWRHVLGEWKKRDKKGDPAD